NDLQAGLRLGAHGQPAEAVVHGHVRAHLKPQLVAVERQGLALVQDVNGGVTQARDHSATLPREEWAIPVRNITSAAGSRFSNIALGEKKLGLQAGRCVRKHWLKQKGTKAQGCRPGTVTQARTRRRNWAGDRPTRLRNSVLKLPSEEKPTSKHMSVTGRFVTVSSSLARSMRSRVRKAWGVSPKAPRNARRKCQADISASWHRSSSRKASSRQSRIRSRTWHSRFKLRDEGMPGLQRRRRQHGE